MKTRELSPTSESGLQKGTSLARYIGVETRSRGSYSYSYSFEPPLGNYLRMYFREKKLDERRQQAFDDDKIVGVGENRKERRVKSTVDFSRGQTYGLGSLA